MKKQKMYIPILEKKLIIGTEKWDNRVTLLCANKIKLLEEYLPSVEALSIHMEMQKIELQKDEKYEPKPLYISLEESIFNDIIKRIKGKNSKTPDDHIPLVLQYPAIPICVIKSK